MRPRTALGGSTRGENLVFRSERSIPPGTPSPECSKEPLPNKPKVMDVSRFAVVAQVDVPLVPRLCEVVVRLDSSARSRKDLALVERDNVRDHRAGTSDQPFQKHAQVRLRVHHIVMLLSMSSK